MNMSSTSEEHIGNNLTEPILTQPPQDPPPMEGKQTQLFQGLEFLRPAAQIMTDKLKSTFEDGNFVKEKFQSLIDRFWTDPFTTTLYILMFTLGFVPILSFFLIICGTILFSIVCFVTCNTIVFLCTAAICGMFFLFVVVTSLFISTFFGVGLNMLRGWHPMLEHLSQNWKPLVAELWTLVRTPLNANIHQRRKDVRDGDVQRD